MRAAFVSTLTDLAAHDPRIVLLTGDLGFMALEPFSERFPERFINVGVAEQNMVGIATGLAEAGYIPFVYSIVTFASLRPYEFIRNGPVLHHLPVRIVGIGGGFEYGHAGSTHHGLEDIGAMRMQPDLAVMAPADSEQTREVLRRTWDLPGPIYYRLGKDDRTVIPQLDGRFEIGRTQTVQNGNDVLIIAMGSVASEAARAAQTLCGTGISCAMQIVASIQPTPLDDLAEALERYRLVFTVEAHYAAGGLGSLVAEVAADRGIATRIVRCAVREGPDGRSGSQGYLHDRHGLSAEALVETVLQEIGSPV